MKKPYVAIVDDDSAFAAYLRTFLSLRGYEARCYTRGDEIAFAVRARYDASSKDAKPTNVRRFEHAKNALAKLANGMKRHLGKATLDGPDLACFERSDLGPLLVARRDLEIVLIAGPARSARGTSSTSTWTSTSTCSHAKTWADEIFAAP